MKLTSLGRETYAVAIGTLTSSGDPIAADAWEASFDGGTNWHAATADGEYSTWLVAGEDADPGTAVAVLTSTVIPIARAIDEPEILIDDAMPVIVYQRI